MKQSDTNPAVASGAAARRSRANKSLAAQKPVGHALVFFEWLQPQGVPFAEAGPAVVVLSETLDQAAARRELARIAGRLKSPFTMGGRAKITGRMVQLSRHELSDDDRCHAWDTMVDEMNEAGWSQGQADQAFDSVFQIYDGAKKKGDLGRMLQSAVSGKNKYGSKLGRGSVLMIPRSEEWPTISLSHENLAEMLASIYGRGAVYYLSDQPRPGGKVKLRMRKRKRPEPDKPYSDGYDDEEDLPGDEWKKGGDK